MSYGGDFACNEMRNLAAGISVKNSITYHLFDTCRLEVLRKASWIPQHKCNTFFGGGGFNSYLPSTLASIPGLDFNPDGLKIATIDTGGVFIISDVDVGNVLYSIQLERTHSTDLNKSQFI